MTCLVAIAQGGHVHMGADSMVSCGGLIFRAKQPKIFRNGPFLLAGCGYARFNQVLRHVRLPKPPKGRMLLRFMEIDFTQGMRQAFKEVGFLKTDDGIDEVPNSLALVGVHGRLFSVDGDLTTIEYADNEYASGSGGEVALGVLWATRGMLPRTRIKMALEAASHHCQGVGPPFIYGKV